MGFGNSRYTRYGTGAVAAPPPLVRIPGGALPLSLYYSRMRTVASPAMQRMIDEFMGRQRGLSGMGCPCGSGMSGCCGSSAHRGSTMSGMGDQAGDLLAAAGAMDAQATQLDQTVYPGAGQSLRDQAASLRAQAAALGGGSSSGFDIGSLFSGLFGAPAKPGAPASQGILSQLATSGIQAYRQFTGAATPAVVAPSVVPWKGILVGLAALGGAVGIAMAVKSRRPAVAARRRNVVVYRRRRAA